MVPCDLTYFDVGSAAAVPSTSNSPSGPSEAVRPVGYPTNSEQNRTSCTRVLPTAGVAVDFRRLGVFAATATRDRTVSAAFLVAATAVPGYAAAFAAIASNTGSLFELKYAFASL